MDQHDIGAFGLKDIVDAEVPAGRPVAMCSVLGYDASFKIDQLVASSPGVRCTSVAMGSQEGFALADQAIAAANKSGTWVMLKNVHLAPAWLGQLEKKLQSMQFHPRFRLFITFEANEAVPTSVLRASDVIMNEPPPGVRASLLDSLRSISQERLDAKGPVERFRLYLALAWVHATLVERLRYVPVGFSKTHEFNDSDFNAALATVDQWMLSIANGRTNVDPAQIPFAALRALLKEAIYGGRIDNEIDQRLLDTFVDANFTVQLFDNEFVLAPSSIDGATPIVVPEGTRLQDYIDWAYKLPENEVCLMWHGLWGASCTVYGLIRFFTVTSLVAAASQF